MIASRVKESIAKMSWGENKMNKSEISERWAKRMYSENESGVALVAAVGSILLLVIVGFGLMVYGENSLMKVIESRKYTKALNLADAGVDHVTWLYKNRSVPDSYYSGINTIDLGDDGKSKFRVYEGDMGFEKKIISVGYLPDGTKKAVEVTVFSMNIWDLLLSAGSDDSNRRTGGSGGIQGNGMVSGPLYIRGDLPMLLGTFDIFEGPLFIKKGSLVKGSVSGYVGKSSEKIRAYIEGNEQGAIFRRQGQTLTPLETTQQMEAVNIYISKLSRKVPDIEFPAITEEVLRENRELATKEASDNILPTYPESGTKYNFNEASISKIYPWAINYKVIDNNTQLDRSVTTPTVIGGASSFGLVDANGDGLINNVDNSYYEFAYRGTGTPKRLYIRGTVFVDGDLVFDSDILYEGRGTIVVNGNCTINGKLLAVADFPSNNSLGLVVNGDLKINTNSPNDTVDDVQAAVFVQKDVIFNSSNTRFHGAMIAGYIDMASANNIQLILADALPANLPPSLPASTANIVTIIGWREIAVPAGF